MAPFQVTITMSASWRGVSEQFSNVFHYDTGSPITTDAGWDALIDSIVATMKPNFGSGVTFVQGRVNGPTNQGAAADVMQRIHDLSGAGTLGGAGSLYPPEFSLVWWEYIGRSSRGYKRFLRKYFHTTKLSSSTSSTIPLATSPLGASDKGSITTMMNTLRSVSVGGIANTLCAPNGTHSDASNPQGVLDYLHTRQFRQ